MEDDRTVFLNIVVDKIDTINVKEFMLAWMKQTCKDFRIVFIDKNLSEKQKTALDYARGFAKAIGLQDQICIVKSLDEILNAKQTKHLKDTSILPVDKMEVLKMMTEASKKMAQSASEKREAVQETKLEIKQIRKVENQEKSQMQKPLAVSTRSPQKANSLAKEEIKEEKKQEKQEKQVETTIQKTSLAKSKELLPQVQKKLQEKAIDKTEVTKPVEKVFFKIIVPNYNNMPYIKKCLDSILEQTFQDFKIIVVDDLSTDGSDKFCEAYARKHPDKIVFLRLKEKGFAGAARNAGLDYHQVSQYIWFVDSDDWLYSKDVLQLMHDRIVSTHYPDILECPYFDNSKNTAIKLPASTLANVLAGGAWPCKHCISYKFKDIKFKENRAKSNDMVWFYRLIDHIADKDKNARIVNANNICYLYNRQSVTSCQTGTAQFSPECIYAQSKLLDDMHNEKFKSTLVNKQMKIVEKNYNACTAYKHISVNDAMKNAFVISIDNSRIHKFNNWFASNDLIIPKLIKGSCNPSWSGPRNCTASHYNTVSQAKKLGLPFVFVFEDDAYPCIDIKNRLQKYLNVVPNDAVMLIFGWGRHVRKNKNFASTQKFNKPFNKLSLNDTIFWGSHAYLLFKNGYDRYLNYFKQMPHKTADGEIYNYMQKTYVVDTPFFIQYNDNANNTIHNISGYTYNGQHSSPPENFPDISIYDKNDSIKMQNYQILNRNCISSNEVYKSVKQVSYQKLNTIISDAIKFNQSKIHADIVNPKTMTDKIRYVCTYGILDKVKSYCADKILLHEYSNKILNKDICVPIIQIFDSLDSISFNSLPNQFVLKTNHGCHTNIIVKDKSKLNIANVKDKVRHWLSIDFSTLIYETHYHRIAPRVFAEKYMFDGNQSLTDYKFLCFNGVPMFCQIINDRHTHAVRLNYYDMDFNFINICRLDFKNNPQMLDKKPAKWKEMIDIASQLSKPFDFVRVDLYYVNNTIYLGEMTFTPGAGTFKYANQDDNVRLGNMWNLTKLV